MRFAAIAFFVFASTASLAAQDTVLVVPDTQSVAAIRQHRSPQRARLLGTILPGAGHIYAGEYLRGYRTWVVTVGGIALGSVIYEVDGCALDWFTTNQRDCSDRWSNRLLGAFLVGAGAWTWFSSARDAPHAAERANDRHSARRLRIAPVVEPAAGPNRQLNFGLTVGW